MSEEAPPKASTIPGILWRIVWGTLRRYAATDGEQRAASFAYYALFALFPLIVLFVTITSQFVDKEVATRTITSYVSYYIPIQEGGEDAIIRGVTGVVKARKPVGIFAVLAVVWGSLGFFHALVRGVNRAWGMHEYPWYRLPFKNLIMVGIVASVLFIGIIAPAILQGVERYVRTHQSTAALTMMVEAFGGYTRLLLPSAVLFYGFTMFYKLAPRQHRQFGEIWVAALTVTLALQGLRSLFVVYTQQVVNFNVVYGAFGGVVALLLWIYLSGSIIILGGCLSAVQAEVLGGKPEPVPED